VTNPLLQLNKNNNNKQNSKSKTTLKTIPSDTRDPDPDTGCFVVPADNQKQKINFVKQ
jgi:hypothetical protein